MKKIIGILTGITLLVSACETGQDAGKDASSEISTDIVDSEHFGKLSFSNELFDFGTISQGEKVEHSYKFTNDGDADLIITSARGSCGCTVPSWPKKPIKVGETASIDVVFDSNGKSGKQHKKVTIVANTMPSTSVVALKGSVTAPDKESESES